MQLDQFDYQLPEHLIAQEPAEPRDSARLLVLNRTDGKITHHLVRDLPTLLTSPTSIVVNNSRVRHARLHTNQGREVLLLEPVQDDRFRCLARGKQPRIGEQWRLEAGKNSLVLEVVAIEPSPRMTTLLVRCLAGRHALEVFAEQHGAPPLPPYITQSQAPAERYQTVYAGPLGSAAAPTAGLHFTPNLIQRLKKEHSWLEVTLHVGLGTFLPLKEQEIEANQLHTEVTSITEATAQALTQTVHKQKNLLAVGTTSLRTLEGHWDGTHFQPGVQETTIFLYPGKRIQTANHLLTNFHLPKSSLLVLLATFLTHDTQRNQVRTADEALNLLHTTYEEAITNQYRFFSFGDAMLVL